MRGPERLVVLNKLEVHAETRSVQGSPMANLNKEDRQRTHNVTMKRVKETTVAVVECVWVYGRERVLAGV